MRAQMQQMSQRIDTLEAQLRTANARADAATQAADNATALANSATETAARAVATAQPAPAKSNPVQVAWKGAPEMSDGNGFTFKPRGRLQVDIGSVHGPSSLAASDRAHLGTDTEFRRAYLGFDGTIPGGFGYRAEIDVANSSVTINDFYMTYKPSSRLTLILGNQKPNWGLEEMTSDLFTSMQERSSFSQAFGFERRVGLNAMYADDLVVAQAGIFTDDANSLNSDTDKSWSIDGRLVFMPRIGGGTLHLGGSVHRRELGAFIPSVTYQARPFVHTTDERFVKVSVSNATRETGFGLEGAYIRGPFHATAEGFWQTVRRTGFADPTFHGGYAEVGYILTGENAAYKAGTYERIKPAHPLSKGGMGAFEINARYDWLDLASAGLNGGNQKIGGVSLIWIPADYVRFIVDYGHIWLDDAAVAAGSSRHYTVDSMGMRAQIDF